MYVSYPGGCHSSPLKDKFPLSPEELTKDLKFEVSGVLGLNGASVDLYSYSNEQGTKIRGFVVKQQQQLHHHHHHEQQQQQQQQ